MAYFIEIEGIWRFDFNDVVSQPLLREDGMPTTANHAIRTRGEIYKFTMDSLN